MYAFQIHHYTGRFTETIETIADTLVYKFGDVIEFNSKPHANEIVKVNYRTITPWMGGPAFTMELDMATGSVAYEFYKFETSKVSKYNMIAVIGPQTFKNFTGVINYINFSKVKKNYEVGWSDDDTATLTITFKDGTSKQITDYGERGTFGLKALYGLFMGLRDTQKWINQ